MALSGMIAGDRDALICDLAETYGIFNYRALPVSMLATLAVGLRDDSRIKMHLSGTKATRSELFLAAAVDRLSMLVWAKTEDSQKGMNRPKMLTDLLMGNAEKSGDVAAFEDADDYEQEWERITGVSHGR